MFLSGNITSPTFNFPAGSFGFQKPQSFNLSNGVTGFASVQVAQPLTQLYQIRLAIREQELSTDLAREKYRGNKQSTVASVKQAYYATLQTESALNAAQASVKQYEETNRVAMQYLAQQSVLKSDSLQVKAKLAQARYQIVQLRDTLETQKEQLNELLGRDLDTAFCTEPVPPVSPAEMDLKTARQTALEQRPEVKEAEIDTRRADYDRKLARAKYIPEIGAAIHYLEPINTEILPQNTLSAGMELKWDPFDWGGRRDEVQQKVVAVKQSHYQLDETRAQVLLDVDNGFRKLEESRSLLVVAQAGPRRSPGEAARDKRSVFNTPPYCCASCCWSKPRPPPPTMITNKACSPSGTRRLPLRKLWERSEPMNATTAKLGLAAVSSAVLLGATACKQQTAAETLPLPVHTALGSVHDCGERSKVLRQHRSLCAGHSLVPVGRLCGPHPPGQKPKRRHAEHRSGGLGTQRNRAGAGQATGLSG